MPTTPIFDSYLRNLLFPATPVPQTFLRLRDVVMYIQEKILMQVMVVNLSRNDARHDQYSWCIQNATFLAIS